MEHLWELKRDYYQSLLQDAHAKVWHLKQSETKAIEFKDHDTAVQLRAQIEEAKRRYQRLNDIINAEHFPE